MTYREDGSAPRPEAKLLTREPVSRLPEASTDSVFDGRNLRLAFVENNLRGGSNTPEQQQQRTQQLVDRLNRHNLLGRSITADDLQKLPERVQSALLKDKYSGVYVNVLGSGMADPKNAEQRAELSALFTVTMIDYLAQHPTLNPEEAMQQGTENFMNFVLREYTLGGKGQQPINPEAAFAMVEKNGRVTAIATGDSVVDIVDSRGNVRTVQSSSLGSFVENQGDSTSHEGLKSLAPATDQLNAGEKIVLHSQTDTQVTSVKKSKGSVEEMVNATTRHSAAGGEMAEEAPVEVPVAPVAAAPELPVVTTDLIQRLRDETHIDGMADRNGGAMPNALLERLAQLSAKHQREDRGNDTAVTEKLRRIEEQRKAAEAPTAAPVVVSEVVVTPTPVVEPAVPTEPRARPMPTNLDFLTQPDPNEVTIEGASLVGAAKEKARVAGEQARRILEALRHKLQGTPALATAEEAIEPIEPTELPEDLPAFIENYKLPKTSFFERFKGLRQQIREKIGKHWNDIKEKIRSLFKSGQKEVHPAASEDEENMLLKILMTNKDPALRKETMKQFRGIILGDFKVNEKLITGTKQENVLDDVGTLLSHAKEVKPGEEQNERAIVENTKWALTQALLDSTQTQPLPTVLKSLSEHEKVITGLTDILDRDTSGLSREGGAFSSRGAAELSKQNVSALLAAMARTDATRAQVSELLEKNPPLNAIVKKLAETKPAGTGTWREGPEGYAAQTHANAQEIARELKKLSPTASALTPEQMPVETTVVPAPALVPLPIAPPVPVPGVPPPAEAAAGATVPRPPEPPAPVEAPVVPPVVPPVTPPPVVPPAGPAESPTTITTAPAEVIAPARPEPEVSASGKTLLERLMGYKSENTAVDAGVAMTEVRRAIEQSLVSVGDRGKEGNIYDQLSTVLAHELPADASPADQRILEQLRAMVTRTFLNPIGGVSPADNLGGISFNPTRLAQNLAEERTFIAGLTKVLERNTENLPGGAFSAQNYAEEAKRNIALMMRKLAQKQPAFDYVGSILEENPSFRKGLEGLVERDTSPFRKDDMIAEGSNAESAFDFAESAKQHAFALLGRSKGTTPAAIPITPPPDEAPAGAPEGEKKVPPGGEVGEEEPMDLSATETPDSEEAPSTTEAPKDFTGEPEGPIDDFTPERPTAPGPTTDGPVAGPVAEPPTGTTTPPTGLSGTPPRAAGGPTGTGTPPGGTGTGTGTLTGEAPSEVTGPRGTGTPTERTRQPETDGKQYPYLQDNEQGVPLDKVRQTLIDTTGIDYVGRVGQLMEQAKTAVPRNANESDFAYNQRVLRELDDRVRNEGKYVGLQRDGKADSIFDLVKRERHAEELLMAIEAQQALSAREENNRSRRGSAEQHHRREVHTIVGHNITGTSEARGELEKYIEGGDIKEGPQKDLTSFTFVADILMDTPDKSLGVNAEGKPLTYREKFQQLRETSHTDAASAQQLVEFRREYYRNILEVLKTRRYTISSRTRMTDHEMALQEMRVRLRAVEDSLVGTDAAELAANYRGLEDKPDPKRSERTKKKIGDLIKGHSLSSVMDFAIKGGELMYRRTEDFGPGGPEHEVPSVIRMKDRVQGPNKGGTIPPGGTTKPTTQPPTQPVTTPPTQPPVSTEGTGTGTTTGGDKGGETNTGKTNPPDKKDKTDKGGGGGTGTQGDDNGGGPGPEPGPGPQPDDEAASKITDNSKKDDDGNLPPGPIDEGKKKEDGTKPPPAPDTNQEKEKEKEREKEKEKEKEKEREREKEREKEKSEPEPESLDTEANLVVAGLDGSLEHNILHGAEHVQAYDMTKKNQNKWYKLRDKALGWTYRIPILGGAVRSVAHPIEMVWQNGLARSIFSQQRVRFSADVNRIVKEAVGDRSIPFKMDQSAFDTALVGGTELFNNQNIVKKLGWRAWSFVSGVTGIGQNKEQIFAKRWLKQTLQNNSIDKWNSVLNVTFNDKQIVSEQGAIAGRIGHLPPGHDLSRLNEGDRYFLSNGESRRLLKLPPEVDAKVNGQIKAIVEKYAADTTGAVTELQLLKEINTYFKGDFVTVAGADATKEFMSRPEMVTSIVDTANKLKKNWSRYTSEKKESGKTYWEEFKFNLIVGEANAGAAEGKFEMDFLARRLAKRYAESNRVVARGTGILAGVAAYIKDAAPIVGSYVGGAALSSALFGSNSAVRALGGIAGVAVTSGLRESGFRIGGIGFTGRTAREAGQVSYEEALGRKTPDGAHKRKELVERVLVKREHANSLAESIESKLKDGGQLSEAEARDLLAAVAKAKARVRLTELSNTRGLNYQVQNFVEYTETAEESEKLRLRSAILNGISRLATSPMSGKLDSTGTSVGLVDKYTAIIEAQLRYGSEVQTVRKWIEKQLKLPQAEVNEMIQQMYPHLDIGIKDDESLVRKQATLRKISIRNGVSMAAQTLVAAPLAGAVMAVPMAGVAEVSAVAQNGLSIDSLNQHISNWGKVLNGDIPVHDVNGHAVADITPLQKGALFARAVVEPPIWPVGDIPLHHETISGIDVNLSPWVRHGTLANGHEYFVDVRTAEVHDMGGFHLVKVDHGTSTELALSNGNQTIDMNDPASPLKGFGVAEGTPLTEYNHTVLLPDTNRIVDQNVTVNGTTFHTQVPEGTVWRQDNTGSWGLVIADGPGKNQVVMSDVHFQNNGHITYSHAESGLNVQYEGGVAKIETKTITGSEALAQWEKHGTSVDHRVWFTPESNELRLHTFKQGDSVVLDMTTMGKTTSLNHQPVDVQQVIHSQQAGFAFSVPGHGDKPIWVPAVDGKVVLNPHSTTPIPGENMTVGELSRMVLNQGELGKLKDGDIATELYHHENVFNLGNGSRHGFIEAGQMVTSNNQHVLNAFATITGTHGAQVEQGGGATSGPSSIVIDLKAPITGDLANSRSTFNLTPPPIDFKGIQTPILIPLPGRQNVERSINTHEAAAKIEEEKKKEDKKKEKDKGGDGQGGQPTPPKPAPKGNGQKEKEEEDKDEKETPEQKKQQYLYFKKQFHERLQHDLQAVKDNEMGMEEFKQNWNGLEPKDLQDEEKNQTAFQNKFIEGRLQRIRDGREKAPAATIEDFKNEMTPQEREIFKKAEEAMTEIKNKGIDIAQIQREVMEQLKDKTHEERQKEFDKRLEEAFKTGGADLDKFKEIQKQSADATTVLQKRVITKKIQAEIAKWEAEMKAPPKENIDPNAAAESLIDYKTGKGKDVEVDLSTQFPELVDKVRQALESSSATFSAENTIVLSDVARAMIEKIAKESNARNIELNYALHGVILEKDGKKVLVASYPVPAMDYSNGTVAVNEVVPEIHQKNSKVMAQNTKLEEYLNANGTLLGVYHTHQQQLGEQWKANPSQQDYNQTEKWVRDDPSKPFYWGVVTNKDDVLHTALFVSIMKDNRVERKSVNLMKQSDIK